MRTIIVGLGIQGAKRLKIAGADAVATVDPHREAQYKTVEEVPLSSYDAALVCTPDDPKPNILTYLLSHGKHVLVEKPLLASEETLTKIRDIAQKNKVTCYTAYNHRFEPHFVTLKALLDSKKLGKLHMLKMFYGNGTARDVRNSVWRDKDQGVLSDIGSHLLDLMRFFFGATLQDFKLWSYDSFENRACDHFVLSTKSGACLIQLEATLLSWKNTFRLDVIGEDGSAHIDCLCKWGPSAMTVRNRVLPSGRPDETTTTLTCADPTWALEYEHFKGLCAKGESTVDNDIWIQSVLGRLA